MVSGFNNLYNGGFVPFPLSTPFFRSQSLLCKTVMLKPVPSEINESYLLSLKQYIIKTVKYNNLTDTVFRFKETNLILIKIETSDLIFP